MSERLKKAKEFFLSLVFPMFCLICQKEGTSWVCTSCDLQCKLATSKKCPICLRNTGPFLCNNCRKNTTLSSLTYCFSYEDIRIAKLIHAFKYRNIQSLGDWFAAKMAKKLSFYPFHSSWIIVPVPLHWQRKNERGYNQAELIAEPLGKKLNVPVVADSLIRSRYTVTQTHFTKEERLKNLVRSFEVKKPTEIVGKNILLIDDVATTLATLESCATLLKQRGAQNVWAVTIARAE